MGKGDQDLLTVTIRREEDRMQLRRLVNLLKKNTHEIKILSNSYYSEGDSLL